MAPLSLSLCRVVVRPVPRGLSLPPTAPPARRPARLSFSNSGSLFAIRMTFTSLSFASRPSLRSAANLRQRARLRKPRSHDLRSVPALVASEARAPDEHDQREALRLPVPRAERPRFRGDRGVSLSISRSTLRRALLRRETILRVQGIVCSSGRALRDRPISGKSGVPQIGRENTCKRVRRLNLFRPLQRVLGTNRSQPF